MSDAPTTIWAWYFADSEQNEHMQGGWTDKPDKRETEYTRTDLADALAAALRDLLTAVCGETGFAQSVRDHSGTAYPWPALDAAEEAATAALAAWEARK